MSEDNQTDLAALQAIVESTEFVTMAAAVEALPAELLLNERVGAHLLALRTGARALAQVTFEVGEPEEEGEPLEGDA